MKIGIKKILFVFMMAFVVMTKGQTQGFAPVGATWYYETQGLFKVGYVKMEVEKDTIVDNQVCIKLLREEHKFNLEFGVLQEVPLQPLFLSQKGDSVMIYRNEGFHLLFDLGAKIGDSWMVVGQEDICEDNYGTVSVIDKGVEMVKGTPLRFVTIVDDNDSYWGYGNTMYGQPSPAVKVMERVGPIGSYFLPEQKCAFDDAEGGPLRCYIDDELGELHLSTLYPERECDYINETHQSVDGYHYDNLLSVFPNPCSGQLHLVFSKAGNYGIVLYDQTGKALLRHQSIGKTESVIDISELPMGVYCITVTDGFKVLSSKIIVNKEL